MRPSPIAALFSALALVAALSGCGRKSPPESTAATPPGQTSPGVSLAIVAGSENKSLEPIVQEFARRNGVAVTMTYMGSVEIGQELAKGPQCPFDAVWPAASLWIELFDAAKITRDSESILRMPVVFAVKKSVA